MRLTEQSRQAIVSIARTVFGDRARVRLFGSRLDDTARGGDIDLLVEIPMADPEQQRKSLTMVALLQRQLGDQPIDVLVLDPATTPSAVHRNAIETGKLL
jgi:predicted nucleotidyltransferase